MNFGNQPDASNVVPDDDVERLRKRQAGLMKLLETTCTLAAQHDLRQILSTVTEGVCEALECERASLFLLDRVSNELYTILATELEIEEIRSPIDRGITGWVAREKKIANIPNPHVDARWNSAVDRATGFETRNIVAAPVVSIHNHELLGVLELINKTDGAFMAFDERVLQAFASHAANALERAELVEEVRKSHGLQVSIDMGRGIQAGFMPDNLPEIPGYEVAAWWQPAEAVGGDYYDLFHLPDGRIGLAVADVSGHGFGPSLIMASVRAMLHVVTRTRSDPDQIVKLLSDTIFPDLQHGRFITFLMVSLDPQTHEIHFANAGHGPALHYHRNARKFEALPSTGLPLGFGEEYKVERGGPLRLDSGDLLILATDGTIETRNEQNEMFGRERLERIVAANAEKSAGDLVTRLSQEVVGFYPGDHPPDDATVLVLKRKEA